MRYFQNPKTEYHGRWRFRDADCLGRDCFQPGENEKGQLVCGHEFAHGCPKDANGNLPKPNKQIIQLRKAAGWRGIF